MDGLSLYNSTISQISTFLDKTQEHHEEQCGVKTDAEWFQNELQNFVMTLETNLKNADVSSQSVAEKKTTKSTVQSHSIGDPALVQITASKSEIDRRIAAFIEKKQYDVDSINRREFCGVIEESRGPGDSCARTDAIFQPRMGCKSHVKVTRTNNSFGPQTRYPTTDATYDNQLSAGMVKRDQSSWTHSQVKSNVPFALNERISNMEAHLHLTPDPESRGALFKRMRELENRILQMESSSPEYSNFLPPAPKRLKPDVVSHSKYNQNLNISEIDATIHQLKQSLLNKAAKRSM